MRFLAVFAIFAAAACNGTQERTAANECPPGVTVVEAWTKPARAGQPVSAAYVTICNGGDQDDALIAVANGPSPVADAVEIHQSAMADGVMSMSKADRFALPAGKKTALEPGGAHIMLIGVEQNIAADAAPVLRLEFENAAPIEWAFDVRSDDEPADQDHH